MKGDFKQAVEFSHQLLTEHLSLGAQVVDATAGNGYDTKFLAELVGAEGQVWAFDIQSRAIKNTEELLEESGLIERVQLIKDGHQNLDYHINTELNGVIFNLGYLPGGDKEILTIPENTLAAMKAGLDLLQLGGLMVVVTYLGHAGAKEEYQVIFDYLQDLDVKAYNVLNYRFLNQAQEPPQLLAIKKRA